MPFFKPPCFILTPLSHLYPIFIPLFPLFTRRVDGGFVWVLCLSHLGGTPGLFCLGLLPSDLFNLSAMLLDVLAWAWQQLARGAAQQQRFHRLFCKLWDLWLPRFLHVIYHGVESCWAPTKKKIWFWKRRPHALSPTCMRLYPCLGQHLGIGLCFGDVGFQHLPRENYPWKGKRPRHFTMAVPVERGFPMWSPAVHPVRVSHSFVVLPCSHQPHMAGESGPIQASIFPVASSTAVDFSALVLSHHWA